MHAFIHVQNVFCSEDDFVHSHSLNCIHPKSVFSKILLIHPPLTWSVRFVASSLPKSRVLTCPFAQPIWGNQWGQNIRRNVRRSAFAAADVPNANFIVFAQPKTSLVLLLVFGEQAKHCIQQTINANNHHCFRASSVPLISQLLQFQGGEKTDGQSPKLLRVPKQF